MLGFHGQLLGLGALVGLVVAANGGEVAPIELDEARGQVIDEGAIVAHEQHQSPKLEQEALQPFDGVDIKVVGRLIEQQDLRVADQRARQQRAPSRAAGELIEPHGAIEPQPRQHGGHAVAVRPALIGQRPRRYPSARRRATRPTALA